MEEYTTNGYEGGRGEKGRGREREEINEILSNVVQVQLSHPR
jgi:hypothetical protein